MDSQVNLKSRSATSLYMYWLQEHVHCSACGMHTQQLSTVEYSLIVTLHGDGRQQAVRCHNKRVFYSAKLLSVHATSAYLLCPQQDFLGCHFEAY